jgi:hypothetical protein
MISRLGKHLKSGVEGFSTNRQEAVESFYSSVQELQLNFRTSDRKVNELLFKPSLLDFLLPLPAVRLVCVIRE